MIARPASLLRGLLVLTLGAALTLGHIAFAAAADQPVRVSSAAPLKSVDVEVSVSGVSGQALADNCSHEVFEERNARGKILTRRVHACD